MTTSSQMTKKEERKYAKNREEIFREFHRVIAPVVVLKVDGKPTNCPDDRDLILLEPKPLIPRDEARGEINIRDPYHWQSLQMMFQRNMRKGQIEKNATIPSDAINNALDNFWEQEHGSNGSTEQEKLL